MRSLELEGPEFRLRAWRQGDEPALVKYANNRNIWRNLTDRFPHPYTPTDAQEWVRRQEAREDLKLDLAIEIDGEAIGAIGLVLRDDLQVKVAEIGYWLGEPFWGRGLATAAVRVLTQYAFANLELVRIYATVLEWNPASARVLEKAGYVLESRQRKSIFKDGQVIDGLIFALVSED